MDTEQMRAAQRPLTVSACCRQALRGHPPVLKGAAVLAYMAVAANDQPRCFEQNLGQLLTAWLQPAPYLQQACLHSLFIAAEPAA